MINENRKPIKARPSKLELTFNIGAAVSAVGLLLMYLFVSAEETTGCSFFHILQIILTLSTVICAFGIAYIAMKKKSKTPSK